MSEDFSDRRDHFYFRQDKDDIRHICAVLVFGKGMEQSMKKHISLILSALLILGILAAVPVAVFAKDDEAEALPVSDAASFAAMD